MIIILFYFCGNLKLCVIQGSNDDHNITLEPRRFMVSVHLPAASTESSIRLGKPSTPFGRPGEGGLARVFRGRRRRRRASAVAPAPLLGTFFVYNTHRNIFAVKPLPPQIRVSEISSLVSGVQLNGRQTYPPVRIQKGTKSEDAAGTAPNVHTSSWISQPHYCTWYWYE